MFAALRRRHHEDPRAQNHSADLQFWEDGLHRSQEVGTIRRFGSSRCCFLTAVLCEHAQRGAVPTGGQEVRPRGAEVGLLRSLLGLQDPEHGGQLRRLLPHPVGGPGPDPPAVQQVAASRRLLSAQRHCTSCNCGSSCSCSVLFLFGFLLVLLFLVRLEFSLLFPRTTLFLQFIPYESFSWERSLLALLLAHTVLLTHWFSLFRFSVM